MVHGPPDSQPLLFPLPSPSQTPPIVFLPPPPFELSSVLHFSSQLPPRPVHFLPPLPPISDPSLPTYISSRHPPHHPPYHPYQPTKSPQAVSLHHQIPQPCSFGNPPPSHLPLEHTTPQAGNISLSQ
jgi:hypothetical protein